LVIVHSGIDPGVDHVDDEIEKYEADRGHQQPALNNGIVAAENRGGLLVTAISFVFLNLIVDVIYARSEEHTSELQSPCNLVCRDTALHSFPTRRSSDLPSHSALWDRPRRRSRRR